MKQPNAKRFLSQLGLSGLLLFASCQDSAKNAPSPLLTFPHDGIQREYLFYAPSKLPPNAPLLVVLHGFTSSAEKIRDYSRFNALADQHLFAVLYPQGTKDKDSKTFWNVGYTFHSDVAIDDVDYIVTLTQHLQRRYALSVENTFATGMSNGGEMAYLLGYKRPDIFNAIAPVAGMMLKSFFKAGEALPSMPVFAVFGTKDDITRYNGDPDDQDGWGAYDGIPETIQLWANAIEYDSQETHALPNKDASDESHVVLEKYTNETSKDEVAFYKVVDGGHDWPGAWGNKDLDTSKEIWRFFEKHLE